MSGRGFSILTPVVVTAVGITTGISIFQPAFKKDAETSPSQPSSLSEPIVKPSDITLTTPSVSADNGNMERGNVNISGSAIVPALQWAVIQDSQFSQPQDGFDWADIPQRGADVQHTK